jgi:hypothetical protein
VAQYNPFDAMLADPYMAARQAARMQSSMMPQMGMELPGLPTLEDPFAGMEDPFAQPQQPMAQPVYGDLLYPGEGQPATLDSQRAFNEEQTGIARSLGNSLLSGLGYFADSLDKIGARQVRGILGGKPRELLSIIPFSDMLGITRPEDIVSGGDILGTKKKSGLGYRVGEFAVEALLDPTIWFGLGLGKQALSKGGRALDAAGLLDDVADVGKSFGSAPMGPSVAKGSLTPRQVLDFDQRTVSSGLSPQERMDLFKSSVAAAEKTDVSKLSQDVLNEYLDDVVGGVASVRPFFRGEPKIIGTQSQIAASGGFPVLGSTVGQMLKKAGESSVLESLQKVYPATVQSPTGQQISTAIGPVSNYLNNKIPNRGAFSDFASETLDSVLDAGARTASKSLDVLASSLINPALALDQIRDIGKISAPGRMAASVFDPTVMDAVSVGGQEASRTSYKQLAIKKSNRKSQAYDLASRIKSLVKKHGYDEPQLEDEIRMLAEMHPAADDSLSPNLMPMVKEMVTDLSDQIRRARHIGLPQEYLDDWISYFPRLWTEALDKQGINRRIHNASDPHQMMRSKYMRGWFGPDFEGTKSIKEIISDPQVEMIASSVLPYKQKKESLIQYLKNSNIERFLGDESAIPMSQFTGDPVRTINGITNKPLSNDEMLEGFSDTILSLSTEGRKKGGFGNSPIVDFYRRSLAADESYTRLNSVLEWLGDVKNLITSPTAQQMASGEVISLYDFLTAAGGKQANAQRMASGGKLRMSIGTRDRRGAAHYLTERIFGLNSSFSPAGSSYLSQQALDGWSKYRRKKLFKSIKSAFSKTYIPAAEAKDFLRFLDTPDLPSTASAVVKGLDSFTSMFKAGVLTKPSRYVRDFMGAMHTNWSIGALNTRDYIDMGKYILGKKGDIDLTDVPEIRQALISKNLPVTKDNALDEWGKILAANNIADSNTMAPNLVASRDARARELSTLDDILAMSPGSKTRLDPLTDAWQNFRPKTKEEWKPWNIRGVTTKAGVRDDTKFAPAAWGERTGEFTEFMNRVPAMLTLMRKGDSSATAARKVLAAHADYSPEAFTVTERWLMTRLFPFYRFTRKMIPFTANQLLESPGGKTRQTMRLINSMRGDRDQPLPEHIAQTAAIPVPGAPEGSQRFLTGFGLPMEDVFGLLRPNVNATKTLAGTLQEFVGRMNPLFKTPMELTFGVQAFSGRDLQDLRGTLSDIMYNAGITDAPANTPILLEQLISNSPMSGVMNMVKQGLDPRKGLAAKAINMSTGLRFTDADLVKARNLAIRQALEDLLRQNPNVHRFSHLFAPEDELLSPQDRQLMEMYRVMGAQASKDARARRKLLEAQAPAQ